ncbi:MAG: Hsp20/alpha crystallin family protein [Gemmatimonadota bacterium]
MWTDAFADVQEIVNDVVENVRGIPLSGSRYPRLDLYRVGEEGYRAFVDLPGVGRDEVDVTTMGDELTIEGERRRPASRESAELLRSERGYGHFRRSLRMPPDVDPSGVRAEMHEGVLEIHLPRASRAEARKVEID